MAFADLDARAINHVFGGPLAKTVTYTTEAKDESEIPVLYDLTDNPFEDGRYLGEGLTAWVRATDVASPETGDTITLANGTIYTVRAIDTSSDGAIFKLNLTARVRATA